MPSTSSENSQAKPSMRSTRFQPQAGQPEELFANHATVGNLRVQQCYLDSADQGHEPGENGLRVTCVVRQHGCQATAHERQKQ
ncbi:hypothetical protein PPS11_33751 [Pseudomonas putida S11]|nr:hypothetical protein PPS11_33751 [Pseudomonas putida S11]